MIPWYVFLGVPLNFILNAEPRHLWYYDDAYKLKQRERDHEDWKQGIYFAYALGSTVGNMFSKNARNEYPKKPLLDDLLMTESEKRKQVEAFFTQLQVMQANFELSKGDKVS